MTTQHFIRNVVESTPPEKISSESPLSGVQTDLVDFAVDVDSGNGILAMVLTDINVSMFASTIARYSSSVVDVNSKVSTATIPSSAPPCSQKRFHEPARVNVFKKAEQIQRQVRQDTRVHPSRLR